MRPGASGRGLSLLRCPRSGSEEWLVWRCPCPQCFHNLAATSHLSFPAALKSGEGEDSELGTPTTAPGTGPCSSCRTLFSELVLLVDLCVATGQGVA